MDNNTHFASASPISVNVWMPKGPIHLNFNYRVVSYDHI